MAAPFDPAARFLLKMRYDSLFEDVGVIGSPQVRCKGCTAIIPRSDREKHHRQHKRADERQAQAEVKKARERSLAKARRVKEMKAREKGAT